MGDDEADNELHPTPIQKRKADDSLSARRLPKIPRLDPSASLPSRPTSSLASGSASVRPAPPRTQPAPARPRPTHGRSSTDASSSDFPGTISQTVQKAHDRERERAEERQRARQRAVANRTQPSTARKHTTQPRNIRKVTTGSLLENAQRSTDPSSSSGARTRIRKRKSTRLNCDDVTDRARPLELARQRAADVIELTDSTDSARRPSQSTNGRPRPSVAVNKDDPIVISSGSEGDPVIPAPSQRNGNRPLHSTQMRNRPRLANNKRVPPPPDAEVISLTDSEDDVAPRPVAPASQSVSTRPRPTALPVPEPTSGVNPVIPPPCPSQQSHKTPPTGSGSGPAPAVAPTPAYTQTPISAPQPAPAPASMSTSKPPEPPTTTPQENLQQNLPVIPETSSQPSYDPPPDEFDFDNFDAAGDGDLNDLGWGDMDVGASFAGPAVESSTGAVSTDVRGEPGTEDPGGQDALFDSFINMDELEQDGDQEMSEVPKGGESTSAGDVEVGTAEKVVEKEDVPVPGSKTSTPDEGELSQNTPGSGEPSRDHDMNLEEGEVDPNDMPASPETPSSGEITKESSEKQPQEKPSSPKFIPPPRVFQPAPSRLAPTPTIIDLSRPSPTAPALVSPSSTATKPPSSSSASLARSSTLVMPDISSYKSVRFKRPLPEARENPFFSRALAGIRSVRNVSGGAQDEGDKRESNAPKVASPPAQVPSRAESVREEKRGDRRDAEMQDAPSQQESIQPVLVGDVEVPVPSGSRQGDASTVREEKSSSPGIQMEAPATAEPSIRLHALPTPIVEAQTSIEATSKPSFPPQIPETQQVPRISGADAQSSDRPIIAPTAKPPQTIPIETQPAPATPAQTAGRPVIAPPRIPRPHTPLSLVDALNEVFRERAQRDLVAKSQTLVDATEERPGSPKTVRAIEGQQALPVPAPPRTHSETPSQSQSRPATPVRPLGKPPSLDNLRSLLAKRNLPASQLQRSTPPEVNAPAESSTSGTSKDAAKLGGVPVDTSDNQSSSSEGVARKIESANSTKRRTSLVPFEAFISPVQPRSASLSNSLKGKGKGKAKDTQVTDPFTSPTAPRSRASLGTSLLGPLQRQARSPGRARRQSASAAFEACIVRDSPVWERSVRPVPRPPRPIRFSEGSTSASVSSSSVSPPLVPDLVPLACVGVGDGGDVGGGGGDTPAEDVMQVDEQPGGEVGADPDPSTSVEDAPGAQARGAEGEEADETDQLLELASVHLSPEGLPAMGGGQMDIRDVAMDVDGETGGVSGAVGVPAIDEVETLQEAPPIQDIDKSAADAVETTQEASMNVRPPHSTDVEETANTSIPFLHVGHDPNNATDAAASPRDSTTPELVLPEGDGSTEFDAVEPAPVPSRLGKEVPRRKVHRRRRSGEDEDSADECAAILTSEDGDGSGSEVGITGRSESLSSAQNAQPEIVPVTPASSSKTASSTSLQLPPPRARRRRSKRLSASTEASSIDPLDSLGLPKRNRDFAEKSPAEPTGDDYLGRYRVISWQSFAEEQRNCEPEFKRSKDLPHELQDHMNALPSEYRNSELGRKVFEAHIRHAAGGELEAPPIEIYDNGIGDEVTPKWEFHYTNEMWHGDGVERPDIKNLQSCGCIGKCDPKSGTCGCVKKQLQWLKWYIDRQYFPPSWPGSPFLYDHKGVLQMFEYPIFECNRFCGCDEDCPNRVVQNGRKWPVHIAKTENKGVFSGAKRIPRGSYLGIYAGELLTEQEGDERGRYYDVYGRTYLFSIDFHHLKLEMDEADEWENLYVVDAYHAGNFTRFLNHSCDPNCKIIACYTDDADINKPLLAVFTTRDVDPWEELCFSYYGDIDGKREEIQESRQAGEESVKEHAVYARCRCDADNCIGRLFS